MEEINKLLAIYYDENLVKQYYGEQNKARKKEEKINQLKKEKKDMEKQILKKEKIIPLLYEDRANGILAMNEFVILQAKVKQEIDNYQQRILQIEKKIIVEKEDNITMEELPSKIKKYSIINILDRTIVDQFIMQIEIGKYQTENNIRHIKIVWNT